VSQPIATQIKSSDKKLMGVKPVTPFTIFNLCIERAHNLIKIHEAAHGTKAKPEKYLADAHRAAIVLTISALDAYIRSLIISKIREILANKTQLLPVSLFEQIKKFLNQDVLLEAARKDDLLDRVEKAFQSDFERKSFQGTKNIEDYMKMAGFDNIFHAVAMNAGINEDTLRSNIDRFTNRRHTIAHKGDYNLKEQPPRENVITKKDAQECIKIVTIVAKEIHKLSGSGV
jgi:hypothetical protein